MADASLEQKIVTKLREIDPNLYQAKEPGMKDPIIGQIASERDAVLITQDIRTFLIENYHEHGKLPEAGFVQIRMDGMKDEAKAERLILFLNKYGHELSGKVATVEHRTERIRPSQEVIKDIDYKATLKQEKEPERARPASHNKNHEAIEDKIDKTIEELRKVSSTEAKKEYKEPTEDQTHYQEEKQHEIWELPERELEEKAIREEPEQDEERQQEDEIDEEYELEGFESEEEFKELLANDPELARMVDELKEGEEVEIEFEEDIEVEQEQFRKQEDKTQEELDYQNNRVEKQDQQQQIKY